MELTDQQINFWPWLSRQIMRLSAFMGLWLAMLAAEVQGGIDQASLAQEYRNDHTFIVDLGPRRSVARLEMITFFMDHLDLCAQLAQQLKIDTYEAKKVGPNQFYGHDGESAEGSITVLNQAADERTFLLKGSHHDLFTIHGSSHLTVQFNESQDIREVENNVVDYTMRAFVRVDNGFFAFFSRIFRSAARNAADRQLSRMLRVPLRVAETVALEPERVRQYLRSSEAKSLETMSGYDDFRTLMDRYASAALRRP